MSRKIFAIGILLFLTQSPFVICGIWEPSNKKNETVCKSDACSKRGKLYFENLNPTVHPCDDFYSFVCGTWYMQNKSPKRAAKWTAYDVLEKQLFEDLRDILEKPVNPSHTEMAQVKYFYDICAKQPSYGRKSPKDIASQIAKIGRYKKKSVWDIHEGYLKLTGESAFFDYRTYALRPKELLPALIIQALDSPYGAIKHGKWKREEENNYEDFLYLLMKSLKMPGTDADLKSKVKKVAEFRHQLNEFIVQSRRRSTMTTKYMTPREFEQWFKAFGDGRTKQLGVPWEKIIKTILSVIPKGPIHNMAITTVYEQGYFSALDQWLALTSDQVLADHMEMYFAERHTDFTEEMEDLLEKTTIDPTDLTEYIREDTPRWVTCIDEHNMWPEIGKILQEKWFNKDITQPMKEIVEGLKLAASFQVKGSTWLNPPTKAETIKKIINVKPWIGFPPSYSNPAIEAESDSASKDPTRPEAYFNFKNQVIFMKSPLLRPPFFDPNLPNIYNYGAIGQVVGHELHHAIHDCGMYWNEGNKEVRWWPNEMRDRCQTQMKCFIDAYNKETQKAFQSKYHEATKLTNKISYLEDYPDVMGLEAAFRFYLVMLKKDKNVCQTLPRFEKYSCEQMFFISYANTMCAKLPTKAAAMHDIATDGHSLNSVRVNGAVQNSEFFQRAFQCAPGKPMNPPVKCNLWK